MGVVVPMLGLDTATRRRADEMARRDAARSRSRVVMEYIGGALITMGHYSSAADAKSMRTDVGRWHEIGDGTDNWRSENGRVLVLSDVKWAPPC